jgi:prolyl-tRNA synthetase
MGTTIREQPAEAEMISHRLLLRAGYIRQLTSGVFSLLPLGVRAVGRIEAVIREEMDAIGGQEISMPVVHPAEIWQRSGRWGSVDQTLVRFEDRRAHPMVLAMTHEEVVATLAASEVSSYRDLPRLVYQIQTKFRDEARPRAGLIRAREFVMKDSYSLDVDEAGLHAQYDAHHAAYLRIFRRLGLPVVSVLSDVGVMGGKVAHEFMYLTPVGEDRLAICPACGYMANFEVADFQSPEVGIDPPREMTRVATPGTSTIEALAAHLDLPTSALCKAVFLAGRVAGATEEQVVLALVRGDMDVNLSRLQTLVGSTVLRPATEEEILAIGAVPGYASAIGLVGGRQLVVVDELVTRAPNLVAGANEVGFHLLDTNYGRDITADIVGKISEVWEGAGCPQCGAPLTVQRGVEVGNIFQLGTRYSDALGATFTDVNGAVRPIWMGSYGIGVGRLLACLAEEHHDDRGLTLPVAVSPYPIVLVSLAGEAVEAVAAQTYDSLAAEGISCLWDDREVSAGIKFADADLRGAPLRITVSDRSLKGGGAEVKWRSSNETEIVPVTDLVSHLRGALERA